MEIDVKKLVPSWVVQEKTHSVTLWFSDVRGNYNRKAFELPKKILVDRTFAEAIGMFLGDGDMHRKEKGHLTYASIDVDIAAVILDFLRQRLLVQNKDITMSVHYRYENPNIKMIARLLGYEQSRITVRVFERNRHPAIHIQVNGKVFRLMFENKNGGDI